MNTPEQTHSVLLSFAPGTCKVVVRPAERDIHLSCKISAVDCVKNLSADIILTDSYIVSFPGSRGSLGTRLWSIDKDIHLTMVDEKVKGRQRPSLTLISLLPPGNH